MESLSSSVYPARSSTTGHPLDCWASPENAQPDKQEICLIGLEQIDSLRNEIRIM